MSPRRPVNQRPSRRRPRLLIWLAAAFLVLPLLEIVVIIQVGQEIGGWFTIGALLVLSAVGAVIVRREGTNAWRALRDSAHLGRLPSRELADAALVLVGGTLLLAPGFLTDIAGFVCVLPVTRPLVRRLLLRLLKGRVTTVVGSPGATRTHGPHRRVPRPQDQRIIVTGEVVNPPDSRPGDGSTT